MRTLHTTIEVIDALGGNKPFAKITCTPKVKRTDQHVSNYRSTNKFPAEIIYVVNAELAKRGFKAPASMFDIYDPKEPQRKAG